MKSTASPNLQLLRCAVEDDRVKQLTDWELLKRFQGERDESAFHALVRRHGSMVLDVCRNVIGNHADADDAFQATFLIFTQKAGTIRKQASVGSWLHGVAYRTALKAQRDCGRRHKHETCAPGQPPAAGSDDVPWREVRQVLHEELTKISDCYRSPLVLCYLQGKTQDEAAKLLGVSKATVKKRLERGRALLRTRLLRRGLGAAAVCLVAAWPAAVASARVSPALVSNTVDLAKLIAAGETSAAGMISTNVAALMEGVLRTMFVTHLKTATASLLVAGILAAGLLVAGLCSGPQSSLAQQPGRQDPTNAPKVGKAPLKANAPAKDTIEVRGRVLDPEGKPVTGAKLYVNDRPCATSGDDGRFTFAVEKSDDAGRQVMAIAKGQGCAWAMVSTEELTLRLVKDVPIIGRILDPEGRPVVGAKVAVIGVSAAKGNELQHFLNATQYGTLESRSVSPNLWVGSLPGITSPMTTGADGKFKLAGVGSERVVGLRLEGPGIASAGLVAIAKTGDQAGGIYGASFEYLAVSSRPIRGVVRDKADGKPIAGVSISLNLYRWRGRSRWANAVTDKEGRYELLGVDKSPDYPLVVKPADGLYFHRSVELKDTAGLDVLNGDFDLVQGGVTVRGKVTDKATGKPIANSRVNYHPLYPNANVNKLDGFWHPHSETTTGPDGTYTLSVLAGPGVISVAGPQTDIYLPARSSVKERKEFFKLPLAMDNSDDPVPSVGGNALGLPISRDSYNAMVLVEPAEKDKSLVTDVGLEAARTLKGRVVGPEGQPLTGVLVVGLFQRSFDTLKDAEFTVRAVNPRATRQLAFYHKDKNLGFFLKELRGDAPEPVTVTMEPCGSASGRIVDGDGQPLVGFKFGLGGWGGSQQATTDKDGRFRVEGLIPGVDYGLIPSTGFFILGHVTAESGKNKDMGDIKNRTQ